MSNQIIIDDGFKTYELINKEKKVLGVISFNPSDVNIVYRYKEVVEELEKINVNTKAEGNTEETIEAIRQADEIAYEKINYLANADVAQTLFSIMGPYSIMPSGQSFVEYIMEVIANIITQETGVRVKKMNKRIQKHTSKYHG
jgi:uncharacterized protein YqgV (UPF0045/DUF77 family)